MVMYFFPKHCNFLEVRTCNYSGIELFFLLEVSENDQSFEVTMTATTEVADDEITEGTVTQIQVQ